MTVEPGKAGATVGEVIAHASDAHQSILNEAKTSRTESGRTVCGPDTMLDPLNRSFGSIQLQRCPLGGSGMIHGGGGHDFQSPEHSLPDMAIILYSDAAASLVVGSRDSDLMVEPRETDVEAAQDVFEAVVGVPVESPVDVTEAIEAGAIDNPPQARAEIRSELSTLFERVPTEVEVMPSWIGDANAGMIQAAASTPGNRASGTAMSLWTIATNLFTFDLDSVEINLAQAFISEIAGAAVLLVFLYVLGGTPSQVARNGM